jgi:hypothetical protein
MSNPNPKSQGPAIMQAQSANSGILLGASIYAVCRHSVRALSSGTRLIGRIQIAGHLPFDNVDLI